MFIPLKKQVISFQTAKKFKELNYKQESLWYWVQEDKEEPQLALYLKEENQFLPEKENFQYSDKIFYNFYSAFTASELELFDDIRILNGNR